MRAPGACASHDNLLRPASALGRQRALMCRGERTIAERPAEDMTEPIQIERGRASWQPGWGTVAGNVSGQVLRGRQRSVQTGDLR